MIYDLGLKRIHLFKVMNEGIELPGTRGGVRLAVGGDVFCGLEIGFQLGFARRLTVVPSHEIGCKGTTKK